MGTANQANQGHEAHEAPSAPDEKLVQEKYRKAAVIVSAGLVLVLAFAAAAAACAALCSTALTCSVSPLSMALRGSGNHPGGHIDTASAPGSNGGSCPVQYAVTMRTRHEEDASVNVTAPLLLGGAAVACTCGCQPRDSLWSESCRMDPTSRTTWGLCEPQQRRALVELATNLYNGSMLQFHPCDLYQLIKGRTLWLIGDSHMKSTYTAIRCIMLDFWDHSQGECAASSDPAQQLELHKAELYAPRNLSLAEITEPRCIHLIGGGRICFLHAVRGEVLVSGNNKKPGVLELIQQRQLAGGDDVFYASTGRWYTHNCTGFEVPPYNSSLNALGLHYKETRADWPHLFYAVPPFDHTTCNIAFDYTKEAACPAAGNGSSIDLYNRITSYAHAILERQGVYVIDYMNMTQPLDWAHLGHTRSFKNAIDCLHYCRPGIPEMDVWFLYTAMKQQGVKPLTRSVVDTTADRSTFQTDLPCTPVKPFL